MNAPAIGEPMAAATPWKSRSKPKAFVSFSKPSKSTTTMDRKEAKHAVTKKKMLSYKFMKSTNLHAINRKFLFSKFFLMIFFHSYLTIT